MRSNTVELEASDGHQFQAYQSHPNGTPKGGVVVLQEIFGVTDHIRRATDRFAEAGYLAIAPALFDRIEPGVELERYVSPAFVARRPYFLDPFDGP